jgi:uncharacterized protein YcbK (DUF882 family)
MTLARRVMLKRGLGLAAFGATAGAAPMAMALSGIPARRLAFDNLHTGETLDVAYWENGVYVPGALSAVNHVLRDHRNNQVHVIEPTLLDLLTALSAMLDTRERFNVISGYRSPESNAIMHEHSGQVASGSLHMQGMAIDIRLAGVSLDRIRAAAETLGIGGVGYYPTSDFVHVDVGKPRTWSGT